MAANPTKEMYKALKETEQMAADRARLVEQNKKAAQEQLLRIQLLLAKRPVKSGN